MLRLTVHFRNTAVQVTHNTYECNCEYVLIMYYCGHKILVGGNCMGNNHYRRKEGEIKRMYHFGEEKKS